MVYYQEKISHRSGAHSTSGAEQRRYTILDPIEARIIQIIDAHRDELEAIAARKGLAQVSELTGGVKPW